MKRINCYWNKRMPLKFSINILEVYQNLWTLDPGLWTLDSRFWMLDWMLNCWTSGIAECYTVGVKTLKFTTAQSFGNNRSISITSFLNSTLIKIFSHFRCENLSTIYSFQATPFNHLKYQKPEVFRWCEDGRSTWNRLLWYSVSVKAQTLSILADNIYFF